MGPPMSQILKEAARRGSQLPIEDAGFSQRQEGPTPKKQATVKEALLKKPSRKPLVPPKELELSVAISVGNFDIDITLLKKMEEFLAIECLSGLCSIERGGALSRLHLQMVCQIMAASTAMVSKQIKTYLGWDKPEAAPLGHLILSKTLRNTGLHTFTGMLGYCIKDRGKDHFGCVHWNVTHEEIEEGIEEYVKHGTPFAKNRIILTHKNLMERAATFCRYKLRKQLGSTLPGTLLPMLQSGQYIPLASWVLLLCQGGIEYTRSAVLWKCMMQPGTLNMDNVTQIFFEHTNPGSRLTDLGRQRLASSLDETQEGAHSDYVVPGFTLGDVDNVVVLEDTQDEAVPPTQVPDNTADAIVHTPHALMFIPVVYGDCDDLNSFQL